MKTEVRQNGNPFVPRTKYCIRKHSTSGWVHDFDWITYSEIDALLNLHEGEPVSLAKAAEIYYAATIDAKGEYVTSVIEAGLINYVLSLGFRIDIFAELVFPNNPTRALT